jgi:hypothetical protein
MGVYTGLAKLGAKKWETRRYGRRTQSGETERTVEETRFVCAECGEFYAFEFPCPKCDKPVVDRTIAVPALGRDVRQPWFARFRSPYMWALGVAVVALGFLGLGIAGFTSAPAATRGVAWVLALGVGIAAALPAPVALFAAARARRVAARAREHARAAARAMRRHAAAELPEEASEPLRIAGRVELDVGPTRVKVRVVDDTGAAVLAEAARLHVRVADGALDELDAVFDGDEVEIVGRGRRIAKAGDGYRDASSEFELGGDGEPLEVWVTRRSARR